MLQKIKIFKKNSDYISNVLCDTLNIIEMSFK